MMKHDAIKTLSGLLLPVAMLAGCATLNESECRTVDWRELGRSDGARGYEASRLGEHMNACGKYGIAPDPAAYSSGRDEGLQQYCQPGVAINEGRNGKVYHSVCPGERNLMFSHYYQRGTVMRLIDTDLRDLGSALDAQRQAMSDSQELSLYKKLNQNARYLEDQLRRAQELLDDAEQDVAANYDPRPYRAGRWQDGLPYPDALEQARQARDHPRKSSGDSNGRN